MTTCVARRTTVVVSGEEEVDAFARTDKEYPPGQGDREEREVQTESESIKAHVVQ